MIQDLLKDDKKIMEHSNQFNEILQIHEGERTCFSDRVFLRMYALFFCGAVGFREGWSGWNEAGKSQVNELRGQDWYELYGLNTSELLMGSPLTSTAIDAYMDISVTVPDEEGQQC